MAYTYKGKPKAIRPYLAKNGVGETLASIRARVGTDKVIINGGYYTMKTGKPESWLVIDGKIIANKYNGYGYAINGDKIVYSYQNNVKYPHFIGGVFRLVQDGKVNMIGGETGKRGRTAMGLTAKGEVVFYVSRDSVASEKLTSLQLANKMLSLGCINAIELDGGGSSQYSSPAAQFSTGRAVSWWIVLTPSSASNVSTNRPVLKRGSKGDSVGEVQAVVGAKIDNSFGPLTDTAVRNWQRKHGLVPDGSVGPLTWAKIYEVAK